MQSTGAFKCFHHKMPPQSNAITGTCLLLFSTLRGDWNSPEEMHKTDIPTPECRLPPPTLMIQRPGLQLSCQHQLGTRTRPTRLENTTFVIQSLFLYLSHGFLGFASVISSYKGKKKKKSMISGQVLQTLSSTRKCCLEVQNTTLKGALYGLSPSSGVERGHQNSLGQGNIPTDGGLPLACNGEKENVSVFDDWGVTQLAAQSTWGGGREPRVT